MKLSAVAALFMATALASGLTEPARAAASLPTPSLPLHFSHTPLGNVVRVLSAKFKTTVTITANAKAPVSGDFSKLTLKAALAEAGRQAGLAVVPVGSQDSDGFRLEPTKAAQPPPPAQAPNPATRVSALAGACKQPTDPTAEGSSDADRRRAALLGQRRALIRQEAQLDRIASLQTDIEP